MSKIKLSSNERVLIAGKTGSGKTYLAKYLTRPIKRLVVLDGKGTLGDWGLEPWNVQAVRALLKGEQIRVRAIPPIGTDFMGYWDEVIYTSYRAGNVVVYIDEMYSVAPPNQKPSDALWALYTRGRELGVGVWSSTQRPVWIPLFALSEAEHFFLFRLQLIEDRQRMAAFMGSEVMSAITDIHGFYYAAAVAEKPIYVHRLEVNNNGKGKLLEVVKSKPVQPVKSNKSNRRYYSVRPT